MKIEKEPNGYRLEISESIHNEINVLDQSLPFASTNYFHVFTGTGNVVIKASKEDLAQINDLVMHLIANDDNEEVGERLNQFLKLHFLIDEYVITDGLHSGYPNTWPWLE
jgi:hypothetical protein